MRGTATPEQMERYQATKHLASKPFVLWQLDFARVFREKGGFDIIIGNPPYVNIVNLEANYRSILQSHYEITKNKVDLYAFFVEMSSKIIHNESQICFIIPQTWKATDSFEKFRKFVFNEFLLLQLVNLEMGTFQAIVRPLIILLKKEKNANNYKIVIKDSSFQQIRDISIREILNSPTYVIDTESSEKDKAVFNLIEESAEYRLGDVLQFTRGIKTSDDKRFIVDRPLNDDCKRVFRGKNIKSYNLKWNGEYIWYRPDLMKEKVGCLPHSKELFEVNEKIVTQRVNSSMQLLVAYDDEQSFFLDTTNVSRVSTLHSDFRLKYVLALLNSKLINYWYCNKYRMPTIGLYELHSIPICLTSSTVQDKLCELVDIIICLKQKEENAKEFLEAVDDIVFDIYRIDEAIRSFIKESV